MKRATLFNWLKGPNKRSIHEFSAPLAIVFFIIAQLLCENCPFLSGLTVTSISFDTCACSLKESSRLRLCCCCISHCFLVICCSILITWIGASLNMACSSALIPSLSSNGTDDADAFNSTLTTSKLGGTRLVDVSGRLQRARRQHRTLVLVEFCHRCLEYHMHRGTRLTEFSLLAS